MLRKTHAKIWAALFLIFLWGNFSSGYSYNDEIILKLPVRVYTDGAPVKGLLKDDFSLFINQNSRRIEELQEFTDSLKGKQSLLGRDIIISFQITEYEKEVETAVAYFVTELLDISDSLVILTPVKAVKTKATPNKEKMVQDLKKVVEKSCREYKQQYNNATRNLENRLNQANRLLMSVNDDDFQINSYTTLSLFLSSFPQEFKKFRESYLFPDIKKNKEIIKILGNTDKERWWIHFEEGKKYRIYNKISDIYKKIETYCRTNSLAETTFASYLPEIEKLLQFAINFPKEDLLSFYINERARFCAILGSGFDENTQAAQGISMDLMNIYSDLSRASGGKTIYSWEKKEGIKGIENFVDHYYLISFKHDNKIEDKNIDVSFKDEKIEAFNRKYMDESEIEAYIELESREKIKIVALDFKNNRLSFSIDSFLFDKAKQQGMIKVRIELFDEKNIRVFNAENSFLCNKKLISLSLPIPPQKRGKYKATVSACDVKTNLITSSSKQVNIE